MRITLLCFLILKNQFILSLAFPFSSDEVSIPIEKGLIEVDERQWSTLDSD